MLQASNSIRCVFSLEPNRSLRAFSDDAGEWWFIAADVCSLLGLTTGPKATAGLDQCDREQVGIDNAYALHPHTLAISLAGLYDLIAENRSPIAKAFRKHLTDHISPALRALPPPNAKASK